MSEGTKKSSVQTEPGGHAPQHFRSLLVPVDLTPSSDRVLGRVALLPLADAARLTLLHVVPDNLPASKQRSAKRDAKKALANVAGHLAMSLPKTVNIVSVVNVGVADREIARCASSTKAELIVMGRGSARVLRDAFLGSTAERVIRQGQLPVLVVRLPPRTAYSRPALALDFDPTAQEVLALLLRIIRPPRPHVTIIHACYAPYQGLVYPSLSQDEVEERQDKLQQQATHQLEKLLSSWLAQAKVKPEEAPRWKTQVRCGSARFVIERGVKKAGTDLLVLGTHGYSGIAHMFLGTVAGDVLRAVACDVLVVPPGSR